MIAGRDDLIDRYIDAIDIELAGLGNPVLDTVFVGGGTPTHLPPKQLSRFLAIISDRCQLADGCEWSAEANPEDIRTDVIDLLAEHGLNRISLGVQSFNQSKLLMLERSHDKSRAIDAIETAGNRIPNVSIDLIFAAPGETVDEWETDLAIAHSLPIQHLSTYALTFEKGTSFWSRRKRGELCATTEDIEVQMYQASRAACAANGFVQYEISNFAKSESRCRHNLAYWSGQGWYAVGPGAARFVNGKREVNHRSTTTYLKMVSATGDATAERDSISLTQYARERAAFGIRMLCGIDIAQLSLETGVQIADECRDAIDRCQHNGLIDQDDDRLMLTERGIMFADTVASEFLGDE